jgi:hypothetical protein
MAVSQFQEDSHLVARLLLMRRIDLLNLTALSLLNTDNQSPLIRDSAALK